MNMNKNNNDSYKKGFYIGAASMLIICLFSYLHMKNPNLIQDIFSDKSVNIKCDGKTEYIITNGGIYATGDEKVAKEEIDFIAHNPNDKIGYLNFVAQHDETYSTFKEYDTVVVIAYTVYGYKCRNLRTLKIGYIPEAYLKEKSIN